MTTTDQADLRDVVVRALAGHGRVRVDPATLTGRDSLYDAGLTSHATIGLMLDLEDELEVEIPERLLTRETFATIDGIVAALASAASADGL